MKLGIFLPNWIGDVVMATPTLRALRGHFGPDAELIGVLRPYVAEVLAGTAWLDGQIFCHSRGKNPQQRTMAVVGQLRGLKLDAIVLLTNSLRTGLMAWASGARERVGFVRYGRGFCLTTRLHHPRQGRGYLPISAIDCYLQLAYALDCPPESRRLELVTLDEDERRADLVWKKLALPSGEQVVVLNSGGAFGAAKLWPTEYFAALAARIARHERLSVLVNCGPAERKVAAEIVRLANHPCVVSLAEEEVPLGLTKSVIRRSRLLVTTDSGPRFFGVAFGVPVVSLFGPTHVNWSRTHWAGEICLHRDVPCGPCMRHTCPLGHHRCMKELSVEEVYSAVRRQLGGTKTPAAA